MHSSRMRTTQSLPYSGEGSPDRDPWTETPWTETPGQRPPLDRDLPLDRDPQDRDSPGRNMGQETETPL